MKLQVLLKDASWIDVNGIKGCSLIADNSTVPPTIARADLSNVSIISQARLDALTAAETPPASSTSTTKSTGTTTTSGTAPAPTASSAPSTTSITSSGTPTS